MCKRHMFNTPSKSKICIFFTNYLPSLLPTRHLLLKLDLRTPVPTTSFPFWRASSHCGSLVPRFPRREHLRHRLVFSTKGSTWPISQQYGPTLPKGPRPLRESRSKLHWQLDSHAPRLSHLHLSLQLTRPYRLGLRLVDFDQLPHREIQKDILGPARDPGTRHFAPEH